MSTYGLVRTAAFGVCCCFMALVVGCGGGPFDIVKVSGDVAYEDGTPLPLGKYELRFVPQVESPDGKNFPRAGSAMVDAEGKFEFATTLKYADGLTRGENVVYFLRLPKDQQAIAPDYTKPKASPLRVDVQGGKLEIRVPKP